MNLKKEMEMERLKGKTERKTGLRLRKKEEVRKEEIVEIIYIKEKKIYFLCCIPNLSFI